MAKIKIIEYTILKCVAELRADRGMRNLWKTLYTVIIAIKEAIFPYLGAFNFFLKWDKGERGDQWKSWS